MPRQKKKIRKKKKTSFDKTNQKGATLHRKKTGKSLKHATSEGLKKTNIFSLLFSKCKELFRRIPTDLQPKFKKMGMLFASFLGLVLLILFFTKKMEPIVGIVLIALLLIPASFFATEILIEKKEPSKKGSKNRQLNLDSTEKKKPIDKKDKKKSSPFINQKESKNTLERTEPLQTNKKQTVKKHTRKKEHQHMDMNMPLENAELAYQNKLARMYEEEDDFKEAAKIYEFLLSRHFPHTFPYERLIHIYHEEENYVDELRILNKLMDYLQAKNSSEFEGKEIEYSLRLIALRKMLEQ